MGVRTRVRRHSVGRMRKRGRRRKKHVKIESKLKLTVVSRRDGDENTVKGEGYSWRRGKRCRVRRNIEVKGKWNRR